jgi:hypothetical protein
MVIVVPLFPGSVLLATEIWPPRRSTSCLATQSPMPVPRFPFVVKNGSKIFSRCSCWMPVPCLGSRLEFHLL